MKALQLRQQRVCVGARRIQVRCSPRGVKSKSQTGTIKSNAEEGTSGREEQPVTLSERFGKVAADVAVNPFSYIVAAFVATWLVSQSGERDYIIFLLAALPIVGLTALSKSPIGKEVATRLEAQLPELQRDAAEMKQAWSRAKERSPDFGPNRPRVPEALGGRAEHLSGVIPGDYGFDPLNLGADDKQLQWNQEAELLHARWAMLAAIGIVVPEALQMAGANIGEAVWWKVGAAKLDGEITINYAGIEGFRIAGKQGIWLIAACQLVLMGGPEYARYVGIQALEPVGVFLPGTQSYPGGAPFDPLSVSKRADDFLAQQVTEIKFGRLAMLSFAGSAAQAFVTREGPLRNLLDFVSDPVHNNISKYLG